MTIMDLVEEKLGTKCARVDSRLKKLSVWIDVNAVWMCKGLLHVLGLQEIAKSPS